ncbi:MAG: GNAT family N-acetyltransferase, partial [Planctomycetota bacterium]
MDITIKDACSNAQSLMERVMRDGESLEPEYPLIFREEMAGRVVSVEAKGKVRSACGILARDLLMPTAKLRAGMIGSVSTDPDHRRQGLASRLLDAAEDGLREEGCLFALLWADDPVFYEKRG